MFVSRLQSVSKPATAEALYLVYRYECDINHLIWLSAKKKTLSFKKPLLMAYNMQTADLMLYEAALPNKMISIKKDISSLLLDSI